MHYRSLLSHLSALVLAAPLSACSGASGGPEFPPDASPPDGQTTAPAADGGPSHDAGLDAFTPADAGGDAALPPRVRIDACGADNPAGLDETQRSLLRQGGNADRLRVVYPYDGTVFPRGLAAPVVMWDGAPGTTQAAFVKLQSDRFTYEGCLVPDAEGQLSLPQDVWEQAGLSTGGKQDPYRLELSLLQGGAVVGPVTEQLVIAAANLRGSIYYNSYSSSLARSQGAQEGAVLRIPAGGEAELFVGQRGCAGCHGVSASGNRLVTSEGVYALTPDTAPNPPPLRTTATNYPGVSPDGDVYADSGELFDTDTGQTIPNSGLPEDAYYVSFSPDGEWVTFPTTTPTNASGGVQGAIGVMRYDSTTRTFADLEVYPVPDNASGIVRYVSFPALTADNEAVVFEDTNSATLWMLDRGTGSVAPLARAMGYDSAADVDAGTPNLPFASEGELANAAFPVLAPVALGGYLWVIFDSPRRYGTFDTRKIEPGVEVPGFLDWLFPPPPPPTSTSSTPSKQLWVSAIEVSAAGDYSIDRSAPAFYLPGQEMGANNHRAFAALDPCRADGESCSSGTDCCDGFCGNGQCEVPGERCAGLEEACETSDDCCDASHACIAGFCSLVLIE